MCVHVLDDTTAAALEIHCAAEVEYTRNTTLVGVANRRAKPQASLPSSQVTSGPPAPSRTFTHAATVS